MGSLGRRVEVAQGLTATVGDTPLVEFTSPTEFCGGVRLLGKAEMLSMGGSVKDRAAAYMVEQGEKLGLLKPRLDCRRNGKHEYCTCSDCPKQGRRIPFYASSHSLLDLAIQGYKCLIVMIRTISIDNQNLSRLFGAELVLTEPCSLTDPKHFYQVAKRLPEERGGFYVNQFENVDDSEASYRTTEIWEQTNGQVTVFCCAAGTGRTIAGVSTYLKERDPNIQVNVIDCPTSILYPYLKSGEMGCKLEVELKGIEGIRTDRLTANFREQRLTMLSR
ncbi:hypothetical protein BZG36_00105 [Bifiguratus adelaidae]|uniref:Tryptophan synthase beta chain-like PALP domain-containing protein n=1 Tax=Bifiguratus adelaidae TaxID=1938954 RepID=A0A261Y8K7_9FUNG|nr:hypothetical protein BZG36_00105 [Bifiguratus adelaidae]